VREGILQNKKAVLQVRESMSKTLSVASYRQVSSKDVPTADGNDTLLMDDGHDGIRLEPCESSSPWRRASRIGQHKPAWRNGLLAVTTARKRYEQLAARVPDPEPVIVDDPLTLSVGECGVPRGRLRNCVRALYKGKRCSRFRGW